MWEITWCVVLYSTVLVLEVLAVVVGSRLGEGWPMKHRFGIMTYALLEFTLGARYPAIYPSADKIN